MLGGEKSPPGRLRFSNLMRVHRPERGPPRSCCCDSCLEAVPVPNSPSLLPLPAVILKLTVPRNLKCSMEPSGTGSRCSRLASRARSTLFPHIPVTRGASQSHGGLVLSHLESEGNVGAVFLAVSIRKPRAQCKWLLASPRAANCPAWPALGEL